MSYQLAYQITQAGRNTGTSIIAYIYKDTVTAPTVVNYTATEISINNNPSSDDLEPGLVPMTATISLALETDAEVNDLPNLLTYDDKLYYVSIVYAGYDIFRGFILSDYIELSFSTGVRYITFPCVDGMHYLKQKTFSTSINTNLPYSLLDIIADAITELGYNTNPYFYSACNYFANGMNDRTNSPTGKSEPFSQTYIYPRDLQGFSYYEILENIAISFGCRFYQAEGNFWMAPSTDIINQNNYYTKYLISGGNATYDSHAVLNNNKAINAYSANTTNTYFINNSQIKNIKKGYNKVVVYGDYTYNTDYIFNGKFKSYDASTNPDTVSGWTLYRQVPQIDLNVTNSDSNLSNQVKIEIPVGYNGEFRFYTTGAVGSYDYLPYINMPIATMSFYFKTEGSFSFTFDYRIILYSGGVAYYYYPSGTTEAAAWQTTSNYISFGTAANDFYQISREINMFTKDGFMSIEIRSSTANFNGYKSITLKDFSLTQQQDSSNYKSLNIIRSTGSATNEKAIDIRYGLIDVNNDKTINTGASNNGLYIKGTKVGNNPYQPWTSWYKQSDTATLYDMLPYLVARDLSNILNKNIATLEGDLGKTYNSATGIISATKYFTVQDSSSGAFSYNNKKFVINRFSMTPYLEEINQLQIIESTNVDDASTQTLEFIENK